MLYTIETAKNINEVGSAFETAIKAKAFGVISVHNLKEIMANKGVTLEQECIIYEVCNPVQAKRVLEADMQISTALPCRVSIFTENDKTKLSTLKPTAMIGMFNQPALQQVAEEVEKVILEAMDEASI